MIDPDLNVGNDSPVKTRKRSKNPEGYKRNVIKKMKLQGKEYVGHGGRLQRKRSTRSPCRCRKKCFTKFDDVDKALIYDSLYSDLQTKDEQDLHLQRMIEVTRVKHHRPRNDGASLRVSGFKYHIQLREAKIEVCREAYFKLYDVSDKRIKRIRKLLLSGKSPRDMRGKHPCAKKIEPSEILRIHEHISSFPVKKTHYASNSSFTYLSSELSVKKMYDLYKIKYPTSGIKYEFYNKYFNENFNLKFGKPQIDTCCYCEEKQVRVLSPHLHETAKRVARAELMVHLRRAKRFTTALNETTKKSKECDNVVGLVFDYMQNISLPKIPVQEIFYLRQLTVNVFCIFNTKTDLAHYYIYHEGQAHKGPDEVASFVFDYIKNHISETVNELHLFADNCPGQNKNHTMTRACLALTDTGRFKTVKQFFPLRGHSYNPCDRKFSVIKRPIRKRNRIYTPHEVCELIANAEMRNPGTITPVTSDMILGYSSWWPTHYKKTAISVETQHLPRQDRSVFSVSKYHYFEYSNDHKGVVKTSEFIRTGEFQSLSTFILKKNTEVSLPNREAYPKGQIPIKKNKIDDIGKVIQYIPDEHRGFFNELLQWPTENDSSDND